MKAILRFIFLFLLLISTRIYAQITVKIETSAKNACAGLDFELKAVASGGSGSYLYNWTGSGLPYLKTPSNQQTVIFNSNNVGTYDLQVEVTDALNPSLKATDKVTFEVKPIPTVTVPKNTYDVCSGNDVTFTANPCAGCAYLWFNEDFSQIIAVGSPSAPPYTPSANETIKLVAQASGCFSNSVDITVNVHNQPVVNVSSNETICEGQVLNITGSTASDYISLKWTTSGDGTFSNDTILNPIYTPGPNDAKNSPITLTLTAKGAAGCPDQSANLTLNINAKPSVNLGNDKSVCEYETPVILDAGDFASYNWSTGDKTRTISLTTVGTYSVTVTVTDANGCTSSDDIKITINRAPTVDLGPDKNACENKMPIELDAGAGYATYKWSTGATTQKISVNQFERIKTYSVTVTNNFSCTASDEIQVTVVPAPKPNLGPDRNECTAPIQLDAGAGANYTYDWLPTGEKTQTISVSTSGKYSVTVTDANNCTGSDEINVTINPVTPPNLGPDENVCRNKLPKVLDAGAGYKEYKWNTGATTQTINVNSNVNSGDNYYSVTVTDNNDCTASDEVTITVIEAPTVNLGKDTTVCNVPYVLDAGEGANYTYYWLPTGEITRTISVTKSDKYSVTVTAANGCSASDEIQITVSPAVSVDIGGDQIKCANELPIKLDAGAGYSKYTWSTGETTQSINAPAGGDYSVTVTDANGCTASDKMNLTVLEAPKVNLGGNKSICQSEAPYILDAGPGKGGETYRWNTGDTTQKISVPIFSAPISKTYMVTVTLGTCTASDGMILTVNPNPKPTLKDSLICEGSTIILNPGNFAKYTWSTGATTPTISVSDEGNYSVVVTDANNCTGSASMNLSVVKDKLDIDSPQEFCRNGDPAILDAGPGFDLYEWSTGDKTQTITITIIPDRDIYFVTATMLSGCVATGSVEVIGKDAPTVKIDDKTICAGASWIIDAGSGHAKYTWSTGATTQSIIVSPSKTETYSVTVEAANGCTASDNMTLTVVNNSIDIGPDRQVCSSNLPLILDAGAGYKEYLWSNASTTQTIQIKNKKEEGFYSVTVTTDDGCTATSNTVWVTIIQSPMFYIDDQQICEHQLPYTLSAPAGYSAYQWSTGATTQNTQVPAPGNYKVTVTDSNGCTASDDMNLTTRPSPTVELGPDRNICKENVPVVLDAGAGNNLTYTWSTGETTQTISVSTSGKYKVTVANNQNCQVVDSVNINIIDLKPDLGEDRMVCHTDFPFNLNPGMFSTYLWHDNSTNKTFSVTTWGKYSVTVSDANGCTGSDEVELKEPKLELGPDKEVCENELPYTLDAGAGFTTYKWDDGSTGQTRQIPKEGTYYVTVTVGAGCTYDGPTIMINEIQIAPATPANSDGSIYGSYMGIPMEGEWIELYNPDKCKPADISCYFLGNNAPLNNNQLPHFRAGYLIPEGTIVPPQGFCVLRGRRAPPVPPQYLVQNGGKTVELVIGVDVQRICLGGGQRLWFPNAGGWFAFYDRNGVPQDAVSWGNPNNSDLNGEACNPGPLGGCSYSGPLVSYNDFPPERRTYIWSGPVSNSNLTRGRIPDGGNWAINQLIPATMGTCNSTCVPPAEHCTYVDSIKITLKKPPTVDLGPDTSTCKENPITLDPGDFASYKWSTGDTTRTIVVDKGGTYSVTVSDAQGCTASDDIYVDVPAIDLGPDRDVCETDLPITLDAGIDNAIYLWHPTLEMTKTIQVSDSGEYICEVIDLKTLCYSSDTVKINVSKKINVDLGPDRTICLSNIPYTLDAGDGDTYKWSTGDTTRTIQVSTDGTYSVTVTKSACSGSDEVTIKIPKVELGPDITVCDYEKPVILDAGPGYSYKWSKPGETGQTLSATTSDNYSVTITDPQSGCTASDNVNVTIHLPVVVNLGEDKNLCPKDFPVVLNAGNFISYRWSTGSTNPSITVLDSGKYSVTVTNSNNCTGSDEVVINSLPEPTIDLGPGKIVCKNQTPVELDAGAGYVSYDWNTGAKTQKISVDTSGTYKVTVSNGSCTASDEVNVLVRPSPTVDLGRDRTVCSNELPLILDAGNGFTYLWHDGSTSQNYVVKGKGKYSVTVTDLTGCTASDEIIIDTIPSPKVNLGPDIKKCAYEAPVILDAGNVYQEYAWNTGEKTKTIIAPTSDTYSITVTASNGCTASDDIIVKIEDPRVVNLGEDKNICENELPYTINTGGGFASYEWLPPGQSGPSISAPSAGVYSVTTTDFNGCTSSDEIRISTRPSPVVDLGPDKNVCNKDFPITISVSQVYPSYQWNTGATTQSIQVKSGGTYSVTITSINNCTASDDIVVNENNPIVNLGGNRSVCERDLPIQLDAGAGYASYKWNTGQTTRTISVDTAGTYSVTVQDAQGCSATDQMTLTVPKLDISENQTVCVDALPYTLDAGPGFDTYEWSTGDTTQTIQVPKKGIYDIKTTVGTCVYTKSINLEVELAPNVNLGPDRTVCSDNAPFELDAGAGAAKYTWSTGETTQKILAPSSGTYSVTVESVNGCSASDDIVLTIPVVKFNTDENICSYELPYNLDPGEFEKYEWFDGSTNRYYTVTTPGKYAVKVTDKSGCTAEGEIYLTVHDAPTVNLGPDRIVCNTELPVILDAGAGAVSYSWSPNNETTQKINVNTTGKYGVTVTGNGGCTASDEVNLTILRIDLGEDRNVCTNELPLILDAGVGFTTYSWNTGATTQTISVNNSPGIYTYNVIGTHTSGCTASDEVTITVHPSPTVTLGGNKTLCPEALPYELMPDKDFKEYEWSTGEKTKTIFAPDSGKYSITVTDANGCKATSKMTLNLYPSPVVNLGPDKNNCQGDVVTLDAGAGHASYLWSTGEKTRTINVNVSADTLYKVTVTSSNFCTASDEIYIKNIKVNIDLGPDKNVCENDFPITLSAPVGFIDYKWSTGETTRNITVKKEGDYIITVTDANGCKGSDTIKVIVPKLSLNKNQVACDNNLPYTLDAGPGFDTYKWSTGDTTQTTKIRDEGYYWVETKIGTCKYRDTIFVTIAPSPKVDLGPDLTVCVENTPVALDAGNGYVSYKWNRGDTTQIIFVSKSDTYIVTVTNSFGCTASDDIVVRIPQVNFGEDRSVCPYELPIILDAGAGYKSYLWHDGSTNQTYTIPANTKPGAYSYSVTITDFSGCTAKDEIRITVNNAPVVNLGGDRTVCEDAVPIVLNAGFGYSSYKWYPGGETTQTINVFDSGLYGVTITDNNGCTASDNVSLTIPKVNLGPDITICESSLPVMLDAGPGFVSYKWNTGATTRMIQAMSEQKYFVEATHSSGCKARDTIYVTIVKTLTVNLGGNKIMCPEALPYTLDAGAGFATYRWNKGDTTQVVIAKDEGTYSVTVTDANGCSGSDQMTLSLYASPKVDLGAPMKVCKGTTLTLDAGAGYRSYRWSTSDTTQKITINATTDTIYSVTVTNNNFCTASDNVVVNVINVTVNLGPDRNVCENDLPIIVDAGAGYASYSWNDGKTTRTINVTKEGTYIVTVTDANGCTASDDITVNVPKLTINKNQTACSGDLPHTLDAGPNFDTYLWSTGETTQTIKVDTSGTYWIKATIGKCEYVDTIKLNIVPSPVVYLGEDITICQDDLPLIIDAGPGFAKYEWNTKTKDTTQTINVTKTGLYVVTVTDANGCTASDDINIRIPAVEFGNDTNICVYNLPLILDPGDYQSYQWHDGSTNRTYTVTGDGTYAVTITDISGCTAKDEITVTVRPRPPINLGPDKMVCADNLPYILDAGAGYTYQWLPNNETTQTISVVQGGNYAVTITDNFGCTNADDINLTIPLVNLGNDIVVCADKVPVTLDAGGGYDTYKWLPTNETTQTIKVSQSNTYKVTITQGICSASDEIVVTINQLPTPNLGGNQAWCTYEFPKVLDAGGGAGYIYEWCSGETSQTIIANTPGIYCVTVTDPNGCSAAETIDITMAKTPNVSLGNDRVVCSYNTPITLFPGVGDKYEWSTGDTTPAIDVSTKGTYYVTVTNNNGCSGETSVRIQVNDIKVSLGEDMILCHEQTPYQLDAGAGYNYIWKPNNETTQTILVDKSDTYFVTITDADGCSASDKITITVSPPLSVDLGKDITLCEYSLPVKLDAGAGYSKYSWNKGDSVQIINVDKGDIYSVTITDNNGCTASDEILVTVNPAPKIDLGGNRTICLGDSLVIKGSGAVTYLWNTWVTADSITVTPMFSTVYSVTGTDANGCTGTATIQVNVVQENIVYTLTKDTAICLNSSAVLKVVGGKSYQWSTGETTDSITVSPKASQKYYVTITETYCRVKDSVLVTVKPLPNLIVTSDTAICKGDTIILIASGAQTYLWSTGDTTDAIKVYPDTTTTYTVIGTENGCDTTLQTTVTVFPIPEFTLTNDLIVEEIVQGQKITFEIKPNQYMNYTFLINDKVIQQGSSNTFVTSILRDKDRLEAIAYNAIGCSSSKSWVAKARPIPNVFTPNNDGVNDKFLPGVELTIINRWGTELYRGKYGWDGTYKGEPVATGTYFYIIDLYDIDKKMKVTVKGHVLLVR